MINGVTCFGQVAEDTASFIPFNFLQKTFAHIYS